MSRASRIWLVVALVLLVLIAAIGTLYVSIVSSLANRDPKYPLIGEYSICVSNSADVSISNMHGNVVISQRVMSVGVRANAGLIVGSRADEPFFESPRRYFIIDVQHGVIEKNLTEIECRELVRGRYRVQWPDVKELDDFLLSQRIPAQGSRRKKGSKAID